MSTNDFSLHQSFLLFFIHAEYLAFASFFPTSSCAPFLCLLSVAGRVPVIVCHLYKLIDHIQQVVVVFVQ